MKLNDKTKIYLESIFNKEISKITTEDLANLNNIYLTADIPLIKLMPNLKSINLENMNLNSRDLQVILSSGVTELNLKKCTLVKGTIIQNHSLQKLTILNCNIDDYSFLKMFPKLDYLSIHNPVSSNPLDCNLIPTELTTLRLESCNLRNIQNIGNILNCNMLSLLGTTVSSLDFLDNLPLQSLYINEEYNATISSHISDECKVYNDFRLWRILPNESSRHR